MIMRTVDVECPECGCLNKKLYLDETGGYMECANCGKVVSLEGKQMDELMSDKDFFRQHVRFMLGKRMIDYAE